MSKEDWSLGDSELPPEIRYRALIESIPVVTYIEALGRTALPIYMSPQYFDWFGYTPEERIADPDMWEKLLHPDDRAGALAESRRTGQEQLPFIMDYRMIARDGHIVWVHDECVLIKADDGTPLFWQGVMMDITRAKTLELEREAATKSRAEFFALASHELRSPVTSILGFSATLVNLWKDLTEEEKLDSASRIQRQAQRLRELVDDLLTLALIDEGHLTAALERVNLSTILQDAVSQSQFEGELTIECDPHLQVNADPRYVSQIVGNYLSNAERYGSDPVLIAATPSDEMVEIRVIDSGRGVPAEFVAHLFERFSRGDDQTFPGGKSIGLGLSIVRELARAQGGEAWHENGSLGGACFGFSIPLVSAHDA